MTADRLRELLQDDATKGHILQLRLTEDDRKKLDKLAKLMKAKRSQVLRALIRLECERREL